MESIIEKLSDTENTRLSISSDRSHRKKMKNRENKQWNYKRYFPKEKWNSSDWKDLSIAKENKRKENIHNWTFLFQNLRLA